MKDQREKQSRSASSGRSASDRNIDVIIAAIDLLTGARKGRPNSITTRLSDSGTLERITMTTSRHSTQRATSMRCVMTATIVKPGAVEQLLRERIRGRSKRNGAGKKSAPASRKKGRAGRRKK